MEQPDNSAAFSRIELIREAGLQFSYYNCIETFLSVFDFEPNCFSIFIQIYNNAIK